MTRIDDDELERFNAVDMSGILGTPSERLQLAVDAANDYKSRLRIAEASAKVAWSEHEQMSSVASAAIKLLREINDDCDRQVQRDDNCECFSDVTHSKLIAFLSKYNTTLR